MCNSVKLPLVDTRILTVGRDRRNLIISVPLLYKIMKDLRSTCPQAGFSYQGGAGEVIYVERVHLQLQVNAICMLGPDRAGMTLSDWVLVTYHPENPKPSNEL